jgi:hypothetical protein
LRSERRVTCSPGLLVPVTEKLVGGGSPFGFDRVDIRLEYYCRVVHDESLQLAKDLVGDETSFLTHSVDKSAQPAKVGSVGSQQ